MRSTKPDHCIAPVASDDSRQRRSRRSERDLAIQLRYEFAPREQDGATLANPLFELLAAVVESGSIRHAAQRLGCSYRYVWGSLRRWEATLGQPLISWAQGRRARPTAFAERLLWAERRARVRMQPHIEALRSELTCVLAEARDERHVLLTMCASHDLALTRLQQQLADAANLHLEIGFQGSVDAVRALNAHDCLVAGFHVPVDSAAAPIFQRAFKPLLKPAAHKLIACSRRTQGLMIRPEHWGRVAAFPDLVRHQMHFVNRQTGSGTRMLVDHLMQQHALDPADLPGYAEHIEHSHVAVALCVASGVVDAGVGIQAAAQQFGLHFIPLVTENYFLACRKTNLGHPAIERLRAFLAGERWGQILAALPGYESPAMPGGSLVVDEILPWWGRPGRS